MSTTIQTPTAVHALETDPWCEVCGGDDHSGNNCPETQEEVNYINNKFNNRNRPQQQQWSSPPFYQGQDMVTIIILVIPLVTNLLLEISC